MHDNSYEHSLGEGRHDSSQHPVYDCLVGLRDAAVQQQSVVTVQ